MPSRSSTGAHASVTWARSMRASPMRAAGSTGPPSNSTRGASRVRRPGLEHALHVVAGRPVQDDAEGAVVTVFEQQHHGTVEVLVHEGRCGDEELASQRGPIRHRAIFAHRGRADGRGDGGSASSWGSGCGMHDHQLLHGPGHGDVEEPRTPRAASHEVRPARPRRRRRTRGPSHRRRPAPSSPVGRFDEPVERAGQRGRGRDDRDRLMARRQLRGGAGDSLGDGDGDGLPLVRCGHDAGEGPAWSAPSATAAPPRRWPGAAGWPGRGSGRAPGSRSPARRGARRSGCRPPRRHRPSSAARPGAVAWARSPSTVIEGNRLQRRAIIRHAIGDRSCASSTTTWP